MAHKFVVGDIVKLKSGGPEMTVNARFSGPITYRCQWFAGKKLENGVFPEDSVEKVEKSTS
jgi:uncharacterized protein YodC (DUF2158 family)